MINIRPKTLKEYIGQEDTKKKLSLYITCFKKKGLPFPHTLIFSSQGKGKTTLSRLLAGELGVDFIEAYGPTLRTADDLFKVLCNGGKKLNNNTILFIDECLSGDTEVLTENGWVRLDQYNGKDKVLQWEENGEMSFVAPSRIVKSKWEKVYKLPFRNGVMYQTPNHRNPVIHKKVWKGVKYEFQVKTPEQLTASDKFICTGKIKGCTKHLTLLEKLIIMTQADGAVNRRLSDKSAASWSISLSKERKLQYLSALLKDKDISSFSFREVKGREAIGKVKATRRFLYSMPIGNGDYKDLTKYFNLLDFDYTKAREFMQNVFIWDGAKYPSGSIYCTTEKRNAEFVQAVGMLAGYQTSISVSHDKRGYKDHYRVYFADNDNPISCQKTSNERELVDWNDYMYCLTVPSSFFVIRKNGKTFITGNCHSVPTEVLELLYGLMEDGIMIVGSKKYKLPPVTIIGGTTSAGKIPAPLYTRFIEKCVLVDYTEDELTQIGMATAGKLGLKVEEQAIRKLVAVCSKTPRVLNNLVRAAQVFCIAYDIEEFKSHDVLSFLSFQGIDHEGFNANDRTYLKILFNNIVEGQRVPIGFSSICKKGNLIKDEVENLIEPKMLLKEFISFSGKGRFLTDKGLDYCSKL